MKNNWEGRKIGDIRKELAEEITNCSKCQYHKGKSGCYLWGDKPCSHHGRVLTELEKEVGKATGKKRMMAVIKNSQIFFAQKPTFDQLLGLALKTPPLKKTKK